MILYCSLSHCQKFIIATFYSFSVGYFIVLSSDCFTMMSYWYCVSIVYACHLKLAFVHLLYLYLLCKHSITPCGLNKVYLILSYLILVFHSMCVFRLWSQCPSRCSFHMPDLCVCMVWLISLFKCSSLLSVGSFALIMSRSFIYALMFSGSRGLLGLILPFGM